MRKILLVFAALGLSFNLNAQTTVTDSVSILPGYANQAWYSLENGQAGTAPKNNWDLAFEISMFGTSIHINSVAGVRLWTYPNGDTSDFLSIDTSGFSSWTAQYNTDTYWNVGAFDVNADPADPFDVGWGIYNMVNHVITGDSLFVIRLRDSTYRQLHVMNLASGSYNLRWANLDGTGLQNMSVLKSSFAGKNFGYLNIQSNATLDREPASDSWDLLFTQYTGFVPAPYNVVGILTNRGIQTAKVSNVGDPATFDDWSSQSFDSLINVIGYDWKTFNGMAFEIQDSLVYFLKNADEEVWKLVLTGFGGSATGTFKFNKTLLSVTGASDKQMEKDVMVFPNPSNGDFQILTSRNGQLEIALYDLSGKRVWQREISSDGFSLHSISCPVAPGMYILTAGGKVQPGKVVIY